MKNNKSKYSVELALNISNFDIYKRGKDYYESGKVRKIWKEGNKTLAVVQGTDVYKVTLYFDNEKELVSNCTCPYEDGDVCKHIVAVILSLSNYKIDVTKKVLVEENIVELVSKLNLEKAHEFIKKIASKNSEITKSLKVFVQGQKESPITEESYYLKFKSELFQIKAESLLESFHFSEQQYDYGDDYWDNDGGYDEDNNLSEWVDEIIDLATKYHENNNRKEALKIYFSAIQAYFECGFEIEKKYNELGDWTDEAGNRLLNPINTFLNKLSKEHFDFVVDKLIKLINLKVLKSKKSNLLLVLGNMYYEFNKIQDLEKLVNKYIIFYSPIALNLLKHLKQTKKFDKLHQLSDKVLSMIPKKDDFFSFKPENYYDKKDFEIDVRRILIDTFDMKSEYKIAICNLERLFEISKEINDYKSLQIEYKSLDEKNQFLERIEVIFSKNSDISELFEVFKIENNKVKILKLAQNHFEEACLPQMIEFIRDVYPKECFGIYKTKINKLLEVADTRRYETICTDLLKMRRIGLNDEFDLYVYDIRNKYYKRRKLMEELNIHKL